MEKDQRIIKVCASIFCAASFVMCVIFIIILACKIGAEPENASTSTRCSCESYEETQTTVVPTTYVDNFVDNVHHEPSYEEETQPATTECEELPYTEQQLEILAIIIYQEAGGDYYSDDTRLKVGSVFLNRVSSTLFPDTFEAVATQYRQYGTLYWTGIKWPDRANREAEAHAVARSYDIAKKLLTGGSILPDDVIWQAEFSQGQGTYCYQDGIYFCY